MNDLDSLLHEEGARWRETQPPPVVDWTRLEPAEPVTGGRTRSALLAVAAAAAAVLVGSLLWRPWSGGEVADPNPSGSQSSPAPVASLVPWISETITPPSAHPHATASPPCDLGQFRGTSRMLKDGLEIRLDGGDQLCTVPADVEVSLLTADGDRFATTIDPTVYGGLGVVGADDTMLLRIHGGMGLCPVPAEVDSVTLVAGGGRVRVTGVGMGSCGDLAVSRLFVNNDSVPVEDPRQALTAQIQAPAQVEPGQPMDFALVLRNPTDYPVSLGNPVPSNASAEGGCPWFQAWIGPPKLDESAPDTAYTLNCSAGDVPPHGSLSFAMHVDVPDGLSGPQQLHWWAFLDWLYGGDSSLEATTTVGLGGGEAGTSADPATVSGLVRLYGGPMGPDGKQRLNGDPGSGMEVLAQQNGATVASTTSDADGRYTLSLPPGTYQLSCFDDLITVTSGQQIDHDCSVAVP